MTNHFLSLTFSPQQFYLKDEKLLYQFLSTMKIKLKTDSIKLKLSLQRRVLALSPAVKFSDNPVIACQLLNNWNRLLKCFSDNNLGLGAIKTVIAPKDTNVLGWDWS